MRLTKLSLVLTAVGFLGIMALYAWRGGPWRQPAPVSDRGAVGIRGEVRLADVKHILLPGQVTEFKPLVTVLDANPPTLREAAEVVWRLTPPDETGVLAEGRMPREGPWPEELVREVARHVGRLRRPLALHLGVGAGEVVSPDGWAKVRVGFPLPAGLEYPVAGQSWRPDVGAGGYDVALRPADGKLVSVVPAPGGNAVTFIDQELTTVQQFLGTFQRFSAPFYERACAELSDSLPAALRTFEGLERLPTRGTEPLSPRTPARAAQVLGKGNAFFSRDRGPLCPRPGYPSLARQESFGVVLSPSLSDTSGLPILGVCYADARANQLWLNEASGARWQLCTPERLSLLSGYVPPPPGNSPWPSRAPTGLGPAGVYFPVGNLLEIGEPPVRDPAGAKPAGTGGSGEEFVPLYGRSYAGQQGLPAEPLHTTPFKRTVEYGFRFHCTLPLE